MNDECNPLIKLKNTFFSLSPYEITAVGTILAFLISPGLTNNEQNTFGNWLEMVGQIILTIQAQGSSYINNNVSTADFNILLEKLNITFDDLYSIIDELKKK